MTTTTTPTPAAPDLTASGAQTTAPDQAQPRPGDGGKTPYADPTGNEAAANVDRERAQAADADKRNSGSEAAKYRRQLRDAEAERDTIREQLAAFQRQAVDDIATANGLKPAALWGTGIELPVLLHDDGRVNPDAVAEAIAAGVEKFGIQLTASAAAAGITGGAGGGIPGDAPTWAGITKAS